MRERLVDRESELQVLDEALDSARAGRGRLVVVEGPAGSGKSALLRALRSSADGLAVWQASGGEFERAASLGVVRELLTPAAELAGDLAGAAALAAPVFAAGAAPAASSDPAALRHGLYWLVAALAEQTPLLLTIDDLQWADTPSAQFVAYLAARLEDLPVAVVLAWRPGEPDIDASLLDRLLALPIAAVLRPAPLSVPGTRRLLASRLGDDAATLLTTRLHDASAGNPFFLHELIETVRRRPDGELPETPERVLHAVRARIGRLPPDARALADAIALLGPAATLVRAAQLAGLTLDAAAGALDGLVAADVLHAGTPIAFVHPIVRRALHDAMPDARRTVAHARAARLLEQTGADPEQTAAHLLEAEPCADPWTVDALLHALASALQRGSPALAVCYGRRALGEPPSPDRRVAVLQNLADAEARIFDPAAFEHLDEARKLTDEPAHRLQLTVQRAHAAMGTGQSRDGLASLSAALDEPAVANEPAAAFGMALLLGASFNAMSIDLPAIAQRADALRERLAPSLPRRVLAAFLSVHCAITSGPGSRALALGLEAIGDDDDHRENLAAGWQLTMGAAGLLVGGRPDLARRRSNESLQSARLRGSPVAVYNCLWSRVRVAALTGDLATAEADTLEALDLLKEVSTPTRGIDLGLVVAVALRDRDPVRAGELLRTLQVDGELPEEGPWPAMLLARARLALSLHRPDDAVRDARPAYDFASESGFYSADLDPSAEVLAEALLAAGRVDEARTIVEVAQAHAEAFAAPAPLARVARVAALAAPAARRTQQLSDAVEQLARCERPIEHARGLLDLGAALRRSGERTAAREPLGTAREIAHRHGATHLAERAHLELRAAGARPRRIMRRGADALTPSELRVARMAADGHTNRAIAQQLFVTQKTVETHLRSTYRKLDLTSRTQLPPALRA